MVDDRVEKPVVAPGERVFKRIGLDCEEIKFSILVRGIIARCRFIHSFVLYSGQAMDTHLGLLPFPSTLVKEVATDADLSPEDSSPQW